MDKVFGVIGGGIVGLAIGYTLTQKYPHAKVIIFEKENEIGKHQSGNNSGVLHCGLYYQPGSLKAKLAVSGIRKMTEFCQKYAIPHEICGKIVVASNEQETVALNNLYERGQANGLANLQYLSKEEVRKREPNAWAHKALLVPEEGIVDYTAVMDQLAKLIQEAGGEIICNTKIDHVSKSEKYTVLSNGIDEWEVDAVVSCAGLHSDRVYQQLMKKKSPIRIVPFRGEYLELKEDHQDMVRHLIYPVPDAQYPFLGVHFTRMIHGGSEVGPNAVFATKREGYKNTDISIKDTIESLGYKGFMKFIQKNFRFSMGEFYTSLSMNAFIEKAKKMIPEIEARHLQKGTAGVRAQAIDPSGALLMDFSVVKEDNQVFVLNAPSPGATASLAIAEHIVEKYV